MTMQVLCLLLLGCKATIQRWHAAIHCTRLQQQQQRCCCWHDNLLLEAELLSSFLCLQASSEVVMDEHQQLLCAPAAAAAASALGSPVLLMPRRHLVRHTWVHTCTGQGPFCIKSDGAAVPCKLKMSYADSSAKPGWHSCRCNCMGSSSN
jgi:hypothetical protein